MTPDRPANVPGSDRVRSAVSNGSRATLFGDGRSAGARRYRDLVAEFAAEVGGMAALPATTQQVVRRLAQVSVELELLEAQRAAGNAIDPVAFVTLVNSQRRLLRDLKSLRPRNKGPSLTEHLKSNYGPRGGGA
jgi:hypothetical protein